MSDYIVEVLSRKDILVTYPLVRLTMPQLDLADWRRLAAASTRKGANKTAGILIARSLKRQYICGMLSYRTVRDLSLGRTLEVSHFAALDILNARLVTLDLLRALGPLARLQRCPKVRIIVPESTKFCCDLPGALRETEPNSVFEYTLNICFKT